MVLKLGKEKSVKDFWAQIFSFSVLDKDQKVIDLQELEDNMSNWVM
jgi:hypothetical protein